MVAWYWLPIAGCAGFVVFALLAAAADDRTDRRNAQAAQDRDAWQAEADRWRRVAETQWDAIDGYERRHEETAQLLATLREQATGESAEMAVAS